MWEAILDKYNKKDRHPKCKGYKVSSMDGDEFDCEYNTTLSCDECKYGKGRKNPEAKCNQ